MTNNDLMYEILNELKKKYKKLIDDTYRISKSVANLYFSVREDDEAKVSFCLDDLRKQVYNIHTELSRFFEIVDKELERESATEYGKFPYEHCNPDYDNEECPGKRLCLYIAGAITKDPNYETKFDESAAKLKSAGFNTVNPVNYCTPEMEWEAAMRIVLKKMLDCDGVALLPDWKESRGATLEYSLAFELGIECKPIEQWIDEAKK